MIFYRFNSNLFYFILDNSNFFRNSKFRFSLQTREIQRNFSTHNCRILLLRSPFYYALSKTVQWRIAGALVFCLIVASLDSLGCLVYESGQCYRLLDCYDVIGQNSPIFSILSPFYTWILRRGVAFGSV